MPHDTLANARSLTRASADGRDLTSVRIGRRPAPSPGPGAGGMYFGEVSTVQTPDPNGIKRFTVQLSAGWNKADTGLDVVNALMEDDSLPGFSVGDKVLVFVPDDSGPAIICGGAALATDKWDCCPLYIYAWMNAC